MRAFGPRCNERFKLGLSTEQLETITYQQMGEVLESSAYRARVGAEHCRRAFGWLSLEPEQLACRLPYAGALDGVQRLATLGQVNYYTCRYSVVAPEKNEGLAQATEDWLATQGFPAAHCVVYCESVPDKWSKLTAHLQRQEEEIVLIDDRYLRLLSSLPDQTDADTLRRHVRLVPFGATIAPEQEACRGMRILTLPSWRHLDTLVDCLFS